MDPLRGSSLANTWSATILHIVVASADSEKRADGPMESMGGDS